MTEIKHPYSGRPMLSEVFADPGNNDWYYREKMPDSYARFIRADIAEARVEAAVVRALEAAAAAVQARRHHVPLAIREDQRNYFIDGAQKVAVAAMKDIRALASDPAQVARIAKGEAE